MKYILSILSICFLLLSCTKAQKQKEGSTFYPRDYIHEMSYFDTVTQDSISYQLWYDTAFLVPKEIVPQLENLNKIEAELERKTQKYRDSIILLINQSINTPKQEEEINLTPSEKDFLAKGDINMYSQNKNILSISLYMAEVYSFIPAYYHTYHILLLSSYNEQKRQDNHNKISFGEDTIDTMNREKQELAAYCLIKYYKGGDIHCAKTLARLFREGIYFDINTALADSLQIIYDERPQKISK